MDLDNLLYSLRVVQAILASKLSRAGVSELEETEKELFVININKYINLKTLFCLASSSEIS